MDLLQAVVSIFAERGQFFLQLTLEHLWISASAIGIALVVGGAAGLGIVVLSTVTTTYLDAYSAGVSSESIVRGISGRTVGIVAALVGTAAAAVYPMDDITGFLYIIGSVFAPMIAVLIVSSFVLHEDASERAVHGANLAVWFVGFLCYRGLMIVDTPIGSTLPTIALTMALAYAVNKARGARTTR